MKKYFVILLSTLLIGTVFTSCVHDLDVESIDPNSSSTIDMNQLFVKIYATLGLTGQQGPAGSGDVAGIDEGTSAFYRMTYSLNEFCADQVYWIWPDVGVDDIRKATWTASNDLVRGLYSRLYFDITLCNFFLDNYGEEADAKRVAEVKFIRALNYYYLLDMYGNVPFVIQSDLSEKPEQIARPDLYRWLVDELEEEIIPQLAPAGQRESYYRVDQAAGWLLLSRIYLNSAIYTDPATVPDGLEYDQTNVNLQDYDKAAEYAKKVIDSSYELADDYEHLFMGDNDILSNANKAHTEIILSIPQDGQNSQSYGGAQFLTASYHTAGMPSWGSTESWKCMRSRAQLVQLFCGDLLTRPVAATSKEVAEQAYGKYFGLPEDIAKAANDQRALLCNYNLDGETEYLCNFWSQNKADEFASGWGVTKWNNNMVDPTYVSTDNKFPETDIPLMRKAEAYLNYAEAVLRGGAEQGGYTAVEAVNEVRERALVDESNTESLKDAYTLDDVLDERGREFYGEGIRRSDLIRFGKFTGTAYRWEHKGGQILGGHSIEDYRTLYPLPLAEITANKNLTQNTGY